MDITEEIIYKTPFPYFLSQKHGQSNHLNWVFLIQIKTIRWSETQRLNNRFYWCISGEADVFLTLLVGM